MCQQPAQQSEHTCPKSMLQAQKANPSMYLSFDVTSLGSVGVAKAV